MLDNRWPDSVPKVSTFAIASSNPGRTASSLVARNPDDLSTIPHSGTDRTLVRPFGKTFVRFITSRIGSGSSGMGDSDFPSSTPIAALFIVKQAEKRLRQRWLS